MADSSATNRGVEGGLLTVPRSIPEFLTEEEMLGWYRSMRNKEPVSYDANTKFWNVFRYQDVVTVLTDHARFSSEQGNEFRQATDLIEGNMARLDPPRHRRLRNLVSKIFSPSAIRKMEGRIAQLTEELLDETNDRTELEIVSDLSYPLPVMVIAEMLGVPPEDRPQFREWVEALFSRNERASLDEVQMEQIGTQLNNFFTYLGEHVAERRRQPRQDLLTNLVNAEIEGEKLTDREVVGFATVLLVAGHITTTALLGNIVRTLDENPEAQAMLRSNLAAIPTAIEEVLRYRTPFVMLPRTTITEVELSGQIIPARQLAMAWLLSANHDERQFVNPDQFIVDREPNPHVAFGKGIHFCLGAPLARLESRVALEILLRRYSEICVNRSYPMEPFPHPAFNSTKTLHLLVEPA